MRQGVARQRAAFLWSVDGVLLSFLQQSLFYPPILSSTLANPLASFGLLRLRTSQTRRSRPFSYGRHLRDATSRRWGADYSLLSLPTGAFQSRGEAYAGFARGEAHAVVKHNNCTSSPWIIKHAMGKVCLFGVRAWTHTLQRVRSAASAGGLAQACGPLLLLGGSPQPPRSSSPSWRFVPRVHSCGQTS